MTIQRGTMPSTETLRQKQEECHTQLHKIRR